MGLITGYGDGDFGIWNVDPWMLIEVWQSVNVADVKVYYIFIDICMQEKATLLLFRYHWFDDKSLVLFIVGSSRAETDLMENKVLPTRVRCIMFLYIYRYS